MCCICFRKLVVCIRAQSFPAAGWAVQGSGGVSAADAQDGNSFRGAENFQLFPEHVPPIPGDPAHGKEWKKDMSLCFITCHIHAALNDAITSIFLLLQVSERVGHIIQYDKFYIHELDDLIDIRNDYVTWIQRQMYPSVSLLLLSPPQLTCSICSCGVCMTHLFVPLYPQGHDGVVTLCRYPFVFDAQAKTTLLHTDAVIQMQVKYMSRLMKVSFSTHFHSMENCYARIPGPPDSPVFYC